MDAALHETGHGSFYDAARAGDMAAVRDLVEAGFDVEHSFDSAAGKTAVFAAAYGCALDLVIYLVEECGASLTHVSKYGFTTLGWAAYGGDLDVVRYVATRTHLLDVPNNYGQTPLVMGAIGGRTAVVRYLAGRGCSLTPGHLNALDIARLYDNHETARLLEDIQSAGGWRKYAAARRMPYVRIRHEVSKTYAVLDEGLGDRALLHFLFGRNRVAVDAAAVPSAEPRRAARGGGQRQLRGG